LAPTGFAGGHTRKFSLRRGTMRAFMVLVVEAVAFAIGYEFVTNVVELIKEEWGNE
jgi:alpha-D-ribose 1-methylphosphonate 5-triphosphate synthase subunit PhnL